MAFKKGTTLPEEKKRPVIDCAYVGCGSPALCRVFAKTGWANVCEHHYGVIEFTRPVANSQAVGAVLAAYRKSQHFNKGVIVDGEVDREPGSDDEVMA